LIRYLDEHKDEIRAGSTQKADEVASLIGRDPPAWWNLATRALRFAALSKARCAPLMAKKNAIKAIAAACSPLALGLHSFRK
jgi:hypothetical protein